MKNVVPDIIDTAKTTKTPINNLEDLSNTIKLTKDRIWKSYSDILGPKANATIHGTSIGQAMINSVDKRTQIQNPALMDRLTTKVELLTDDHEARIRSLEGWRWIVVGAFSLALRRSRSPRIHADTKPSVDTRKFIRENAGSTSLDIPNSICHTRYRMFSTRQVAKKLGIAAKTLSRYIAAGKVPKPKIIQVGGLRAHAWSEEEVKKLQELLPKIANGRKTRYTKMKTRKQKN